MTKRAAEFGTVTIDIQRLRKGETRIRVVKWKYWGGRIWEASRERFGQLFVCFFLSKWNLRETMYWSKDLESVKHWV